MTLPSQRRNALIHAAAFMRDLANGATPGVPRAVRMTARAMLRHYPTDLDIEHLAKKAPEILGD